MDGTDGDRAGIRHDHEDDKRDPAFSEIYVSKTSGRSSGGEYIATNLIANVLGLGWACTPAGLKAMEQLAELESGRRGTNVSVASNEMCTF